MYSIYDTYLMKNDLDNRYTAARNVGTPSGGTTRPPMNNSPFPVSNTPAAAPVPSQQQGSIYDSFSTFPTQEGKSIYDTAIEQPNALPFSQQQQSVSDGGPLGKEANAYTDADLAAYPSPAFFGTMADYSYKGMQSIADMAIPGLGFGLGELKSFATDPNYDLGTLGRNALSYAGNKAIGMAVSPFLGKLTSNIANPYAKTAVDLVAGQAKGYFSKTLMNNVLNTILGKSTPASKYDPSVRGDWFGGPAEKGPVSMISTPVGSIPYGSANEPGTYLGGYNDKFGVYGGTQDSAFMGMEGSGGPAPADPASSWDFSSGGSGSDSAYGGEGY
jgi:hypothetical protein